MLMSDLKGGEFRGPCTYFGIDHSKDFKQIGVVWPYQKDFNKIRDKLEKIGVIFEDIHNLVGIYDEHKWLIHQIKHGIKGKMIDIEEVIL